MWSHGSWIRTHNVPLEGHCHTFCSLFATTTFFQTIGKYSTCNKMILWFCLLGSNIYILSENYIKIFQTYPRFAWNRYHSAWYKGNNSFKKGIISESTKECVNGLFQLKQFHHVFLVKVYMDCTLVIIVKPVYTELRNKNSK